MGMTLRTVRVLDGGLQGKGPSMLKTPSLNRNDELLPGREGRAFAHKDRGGEKGGGLLGNLERAYLEENPGLLSTGGTRRLHSGGVSVVS